MELDGLFPLNQPGGVRTAGPAGAESAAFSAPTADSPLPMICETSRATSMPDPISLLPGTPPGVFQS